MTRSLPSRAWVLTATMRRPATSAGIRCDVQHLFPHCPHHRPHTLTCAQDYGFWQVSNNSSMITAWIALQDTDLSNGT